MPGTVLGVEIVTVSMTDMVSTAALELTSHRRSQKLYNMISIMRDVQGTDNTGIHCKGSGNCG
jgi:hypothetical protein